MSHIGDSSDRPVRSYRGTASRRRPAARALIALPFATVVAFKIVDAFRVSATSGIRAVSVVGGVVLACVALIILARLCASIPSFRRMAILREQSPASHIYVARNIPGFVDVLKGFCVDAKLETRTAYFAAVIDANGIAFWQGNPPLRVALIERADILGARITHTKDNGMRLKFAAVQTTKGDLPLSLSSSPLRLGRFTARELHEFVDRANEAHDLAP